MSDYLVNLKNGSMPLPNKFLSDLVIYTKYSNFLPDEHRKQNWNESVSVLEQMHMEQYPNLTDEIAKNTNYIRNKLVLPSMRSIQFGGSPIKFAPNRMYNCSFVSVDDPFVFSEILFLLLCGVGVGYSVQKRHTEQLPPLQRPQGHRRFLIPDSIEGWSDALRALVYAYMRGKPMPKFDYGDIRPKGSIIKKTGGLAPGAGYLKKALEQIHKVLDGAIGRKLEPIEVHDIICYAADSVIAGGVRTSALIALFDKDDMKMLFAKSPIKIKNPVLVEDNDKEWIVKFGLDRNQQASINCYNGTMEQIIAIPKKNGSYDKELLFNEKYVQWYMLHGQRQMSNNSVIFKRGDTTEDEFMEFWDMVRESKSGEPGIFWTNDYDIGTNPCGEISIKSKQFCNLTTSVVYNVNNQKHLNELTTSSAFFGTLQAGYTDFHYLRPEWREVTAEDALLGCSMTGVASGNVLGLDLNEAARGVLIENSRVAKLIGINEAKRATTMKPEGTGTLAAGVLGNGIHAIHSEYFTRNMRIDKSDPIYHYLKNIMPDFVNDEFGRENSRAVISIPIQAPKSSLFRNESVFDLLNRIKRFSSEWVSGGHREGINRHNVSATVYVKDHEWYDVAKWMWDNKEAYAGITILPYDGGIYKQAPFVEITEKEYKQFSNAFPEKFNFDSISSDFITKDHNQDPACSGGSCEVTHL